ncbi:Acyltransferase [Pseudomonas sp. E141]|uniref:acyltransferase family protein n=1 Tax=Pseudomonas sp. E141 TaxID=2875961 RepID=UPI0040467B79
MHSKNTNYRPDIDGLRAVAVILVLLFHLDLGVPGGFVGVDVFFVISGFLITAVIRASVVSNRFSLTDFYARRLLRLHPALIITVALSLVAGFILMDPGSLSSLARSAQYSLLSISNFYFWLNQGYFDADAKTQPLLHTWSLAMEWQFYLIWPAIIWGLLKCKKNTLTLTLSIITLTSLTASQIMIGIDSSAAYYMMPFRIFELSLGAILVITPRIRENATLAEAVFLFGILLTLASPFFLNSQSPFPGLLGLIPCIGAAACIYAGEQSKIAAVLRTKPMVAMGLISYSVYLVHWPMIVFFKYYVFREITTPEKLVLLISSIAAGIALYKFIEKPFMTQKRTSRLRGYIFISTSLALISATTTYTMSSSGVPSRIPESLMPPYNNPAEFHIINYGGHGIKTLSRLGDTGGELIGVLAGDSFAHQYAGGLREILKSENRSIYGIFRHGCLLSDEYTVKRNNEPRAECGVSYRGAIKLLKGNNLAFIVAYDWNRYKNVISRTDGSFVDTKNATSYLKVIEDILTKTRKDIGNRKFIIIGTHPHPDRQFNPVSCMMRPTYFDQPCQEKLNYRLADTSSVKINSLLKEFAQSHPNTYYVDTEKSLCNKGVCRTKENGKLLLSDSTHLSLDGSRQVASRLLHDIQSFLNP